VISSPSTKAAEKTKQNVQLVEGMKRLINHQRRKSSSASLTIQNWKPDDSSKNDVDSLPVSPVVVALSKFDSTDHKEIGKFFLSDLFSICILMY
jgi:hypothetical protein